MIYSLEEFLNMLPLIIVSVGILVSLTTEMFSSRSKEILPWLSITVFTAAGLYAFITIRTESEIFGNMLATGGNVNLFHLLFNFGAVLVTLLSIDYIKKYGTNYSEFYILLQCSVLGMMLMAGAKDLFVIFMGLEIMSISFYALAGINRKKLKANEASLKYFLLGAFATGFIVYGIALIYGTAMSTSIDRIVYRFSDLSSNIIFIAGIVLFLIGFSFKIAAFPFHMWVPDVYQGSSTTVAGLFSTGGKAAAFAAIIFTLGSLFKAPNIFEPYLAVIALFSMLFGSIVAIAQDDIKRMLAYSSVSHAGYMLIGLAAGNSEGISGIIFYLSAYTFMNLGAFGIIALIEGKDDTNLKINDYTGLSKKYPVLAGLLALFMFSLAGLPPFAGFFGKYYIFISAVKADLTWLAIAGVLSTAISVYFYLRIIVLMYFKESETDLETAHSNTGLTAVFISFVFVIILGLAPGRLIDLITSFL